VAVGAFFSTHQADPFFSFPLNPLERNTMVLASQVYFDPLQHLVRTGKSRQAALTSLLFVLIKG